ncbi:MAG: WYL domain-containing protein [Lachnospiraceae bacterium]|nr:WYL domain-containing protein [Lachnospiraceae bacterium]
MAKGKNQKIKLLYLMKLFQEKTDDKHGLSIAEIIDELEKNEIESERKSLYSDINTLIDYGLDIVRENEGRNVTYHLTSRDFELAELKLLVDAIQSSNFITAKKSNSLIKKLENLASVYEAKELHRQVYVASRIKTMNESIYYNVDDIHTAINDNKMISFKYYSWNAKKEMQLRHEGKVYNISPWALSWVNENYYLIGYDSDEKIVKHFRVDRMVKLTVNDRHREGSELFKKFDAAEYTKKYFGMYRGDEEQVIIEFDNSMANVVVDRFGNDVIFVPTDEKHFKITVKVSVSEQFFGWVVGLGDKARIIGPQHVKKQMKECIQKVVKMYT